MAKKPRVVYFVDFFEDNKHVYWGGPFKDNKSALKFVNKYYKQPGMAGRALIKDCGFDLKKYYDIIKMKNFIISVFTLIFLGVIISIMYREYKTQYLRDPKPVPYPLDV